MEFFWFFFLWDARPRGWGYYPSGAAAALIRLLILLWFGLIAIWWRAAVEPV